MSFYDGKNVLVTGGTGLIGIPLVEMLIQKGANVRIASLDDASRAHPKAEFHRTDLTNIENCKSVCAGMDLVMHLAGIKGSPKMTAEKPASFFTSTILFNTNMLEAARLAGVERYLFTSTVGVYAPAEVFREDDVWSSFPSDNDRFAGYAKRMGELQVEAFQKQYSWDKISIVRPANVYGPFDNFDPQSSMVVPSLIRRAVEGENPLVVWGDGSPVRDIIHARDVARGMLSVVEQGYTKPVNLGSGTGYTIKQLAETVARNVDPNLGIVWDKDKPSGDAKRLMDMTRANSIGFYPQISLEAGIKEVVEWYRENKDKASKVYSAFRDRQ